MKRLAGPAPADTGLRARRVSYPLGIGALEAIASIFALPRMLAQARGVRFAARTAAATWREPATVVAELRRRLDERWRQRHSGAIARVRAEAWRVTTEALSAAVGVAFDVTNPILDGAFRKVANRTDLSDSAWEIVGDTLQGAYDDGLSIPDTARALRTKVAAIAPVRGRTIARTELVSMSNAGSLAAARLTGAGEWKQWLATADARTRDAHAAAAGQVRRIDEPFAVNGEALEYPGDPAGSAENVINCRCTVIYPDGPDGYDGEVGRSALLAAAVGCRACGGSA